MYSRESPKSSTVWNGLFSALCLTTIVQAVNPVSRPNIVLIMSDDQDLLMGSLDYMPAVRTHFRDQGTFFQKHYCTIAQCCPSRVSLLTGKAAHNTNITDVRPPYGGYTKFVQQGLNGEWLPSWFQQNSYGTFYVGKLMNDLSVTNYDSPYPQGFNATDWMFVLLDPNTYIYYTASMQSNKDPPRYLAGQYSTDVVASRALDFMQEGMSSKNPFFLTVAPIGPHGQTIFPRTPGNAGERPIFDPPAAAGKYADLYRGVKVPRSASYNNIGTNPPSYFAGLRAWNSTVQDYYDEFHRLRLASLASVDDLVTSIIEKAEQLEIMDNTYFIYTSDNGFHIGQHRLPAGKTCAIEEDINVPFFIRGPGVKKNSTVNSPTSHTDIAPTLFNLAGFPLRDDFDGIPMPIEGCGQTKPDIVKQEHVNVEFWGSNLGEGRYGSVLLPPSNNNTYKAVRLISETHSLLYVVWCTNHRELYDVASDPFEMQNLAVDFSTSYVNGPASPTEQLQARLDTLLMVLKTCKGRTCQYPWQVIYPDGSVNSLNEAMNERYDSFFASQPKITFRGCTAGYIKALEGPGADEGDVKTWNG